MLSESFGTDQDNSELESFLRKVWILFSKKNCHDYASTVGTHAAALRRQVQNIPEKMGRLEKSTSKY